VDQPQHQFAHFRRVVVDQGFTADRHQPVVVDDFADPAGKEVSGAGGGIRPPAVRDEDHFVYLEPVNLVNDVIDRVAKFVARRVIAVEAPGISTYVDASTTGIPFAVTQSDVASCTVNDAGTAWGVGPPAKVRISLNPANMHSANNFSCCTADRS
jgi:hypothetical protein